MYTTSRPGYWTKSARVPLTKSQAMLLSLLLGYFLPTMLMFAPFRDANMWTTQFFTAIWQPCPWYPEMLTFILSKIIALVSGTTAYTASTTSKTKKTNPRPDLPSLLNIYEVVFIISLASHIILLVTILMPNHPDWTFSRIFLHPTGRNSSVEMSLVQGMHAIFQADFNLIFLSAVMWARLVVSDTKRVGGSKVEGMGWKERVTLFGPGLVVMGPAAVVAWVFWWREIEMARLEGAGVGEKVQ
jgi:hypothetical protein